MVDALVTGHRGGIPGVLTMTMTESTAPSPSATAETSQAENPSPRPVESDATTPLGPSLATLQAHTGYRISYRNPVPYVLPGSHLIATLAGPPIWVPGTRDVWVPIRPYLNLTSSALALIRPDDIRTVFGPPVCRHGQEPEDPESLLAARHGELFAASTSRSSAGPEVPTYRGHTWAPTFPPITWSTVW
jgi:hypothetical protein